MRQKAQTAGHLRSTPQQVVTNDGGAITIAPANPTVVYVPVYNPWVVYGAPLPMYPGYYYAPPPGIFWGGLAIGFGVGIGIGLFAHWGWGWGHWGMGWHNHAVFYNHNTYITRSTTVINRGFNRPGGPPRNFGARGAYARRAGSFNHSATNGRTSAYRGPSGANKPSAYNRPSGTANDHPAANAQRAGNYGARPGGTAASSRQPSTNRQPAPRSAPRGGSHASSGHAKIARAR